MMPIQRTYQLRAEAMRLMNRLQAAATATAAEALQAVVAVVAMKVAEERPMWKAVTLVAPAAHHRVVG